MFEKYFDRSTLMSTFLLLFLLTIQQSDISKTLKLCKVNVRCFWRVITTVLAAILDMI